MPVIDKSQPVCVKTLMNYTLTYMSNTEILCGMHFMAFVEKEEKAIKA